MDADIYLRVDADLNCIKGGGACHLREKVLAEAAETWVVVADYRKNSQILGTTVRILSFLSLSPGLILLRPSPPLIYQYPFVCRLINNYDCSTKQASPLKSRPLRTRSSFRMSGGSEAPTRICAWRKVARPGPSSPTTATLLLTRRLMRISTAIHTRYGILSFSNGYAVTYLSTKYSR